MDTANIIDGPVPTGVGRLWLRFYPDYQLDYFETLLHRSLRVGDHVLEIGAGSGRGHQRHYALRRRVERYAGIDPDPRVLANPYLDEGHVGSAESLPFPDASFDLVFHSFVAEHLESPEVCHREIARVLKPGGRLLFVTPSRFHYPMLVARVTPHWFHAFYVRHFGSGRVCDDVFPTFYRCNDDRTIAGQLSGCGFDYEIEHHSTPPGYLRFSRPSFLLGVLIERIVEQRFPSLRHRIVVRARKRV